MMEKKSGIADDMFHMCIEDLGAAKEDRDRLKAINAELLTALKVVTSDLEEHKKATYATSHKAELLAMAEETARAAIARAESGT